MYRQDGIIKERVTFPNGRMELIVKKKVEKSVVRSMITE
jgi:hypothetical protein